jgi:hypothetical protein
MLPWPHCRAMDKALLNLIVAIALQCLAHLEDLRGRPAYWSAISRVLAAGFYLIAGGYISGVLK